MSSISSKDPLAALTDHILTDAEKLGYHTKENRFVVVSERTRTEDLRHIKIDLETTTDKLHQLFTDMVKTQYGYSGLGLRTPIKITMNAYAIICFIANIKFVNKEIALVNDFACISKIKYICNTLSFNTIFSDDQKEIRNTLYLLTKHLSLLSDPVILYIGLQIINTCDITLLSDEYKVYFIQVLESLSTRNDLTKQITVDRLKPMTHFFALNTEHVSLTIAPKSFSLYIRSSFTDMNEKDFDSVRCISSFLKTTTLPKFYFDIHKHLFSEKLTYQDFSTIQRQFLTYSLQLKLILKIYINLPNVIADIIEEYNNDSYLLSFTILAKINDYVQKGTLKSDYLIINDFYKNNKQLVESIIQGLFTNFIKFRQEVLYSLSKTSREWIFDPAFVIMFVQTVKDPSDQEQTSIKLINKYLAAQVSSAL